MVFREKRKHHGYDGLSRREVLAMLVHCVYFRDLDTSLERTVAKLLGYKNKRAERYGREHWDVMACPAIDDDDKKEFGLECYLRKESHPSTVTAPRLAIVLRGTLPHFPNDLVADLGIGVELLHECKRVGSCQTLILKVIKEFQSRGGSTKDICLAGHSLGAGIALLVGKTLVSAYKIQIDTHLFNPPLLTVASFATGEFLPGKRLQKLLEAPRSLAIKFFTKLIGEMKRSGVGILHDAKENSFKERSKLDKEWEEFQKLCVWAPHFYLNRSDFICLQYIHYYEKHYYEKQHEIATKENVEKSTQAKITRLFGGSAKYISNVVPSADLYTSKRYKWNPLLAHSLKQWYKFTDTYIELKTFQPRLLAGNCHFAQ